MNDTDILSTRLIAASCGRVFEAFADPAQLVNWWGPKDFKNTFEEFDFRPGGKWKFTMHAPDGTNYPNECEFVEIERPSRIVFDHHLPVHHFRMTMAFIPENETTRLTWHMRFDSPSDAAQFREFIVAANEQNLDRLENTLQSQIIP